MNFEGKTAIVTGAAQGIGLCIAQALLKSSAMVTIADINNPCDTANNILDKFASNSQFIQADISEQADVQRICEAAAKRTGKIDFLINNAAISCNKPITELDYQQFKRVIDVNLCSAFLCTQKSIPFMPDGSSIVNIASTRAIMSEPNTEAYSASKAGIVGLTHSLALSLSHKIRVNSISPGWIDTSRYCSNKTDLSPNSEQDHLQHPAGRVGIAEDIAQMAVYLCSEKAAFITGQNFVIDGGMTKKMVYI